MNNTTTPVDSDRGRGYSLQSVAMKRQSINVLNVPNYGIPEASAYLHVPISTLRYWVIGNEREPALLRLAKRQPRPLLSFKNLVECYVLELIRVSHHVHVRTIRYSLETALNKYPSKHPFADYSLSTRHGHIYLDQEPLTDLSRGGQFVFRDILGDSLRRVERDETGIARRLFPFTRKIQLQQTIPFPKLIVIDPRVAFGLPVLTDSRISTAFLAGRYRGGDSIAEMSHDYGRPEQEIEEALIWERAKEAA
jgi:uncharacterized protein (DUF433 family)